MQVARPRFASAFEVLEPRPPNPKHALLAPAKGLKRARTASPQSKSCSRCNGGGHLAYFAFDLLEGTHCGKHRMRSVVDVAGCHCGFEVVDVFCLAKTSLPSRSRMRRAIVRSGQGVFAAMTIAAETSSASIAASLKVGAPRSIAAQTN